jgi:hypothetical protein
MRLLSRKQPPGAAGTEPKKRMRLAKDLQCLKINSYGFASKSIDEIGRLVGGWLRSRSEEKP